MRQFSSSSLNCQFYLFGADNTDDKRLHYSHKARYKVCSTTFWCVNYEKYECIINLATYVVASTPAFFTGCSCFHGANMYSCKQVRQCDKGCRPVASGSSMMLSCLWDRTLQPNVTHLTAVWLFNISDWDILLLVLAHLSCDAVQYVLNL